MKILKRLLSIIAIATFANIASAQTESTASELLVMAHNYFFGENGFDKNDSLARVYFFKAAEKGNAEAMMSIYWLGYVNCEEAKSYLLRAANLGYLPAHSELSKIYFDNENMPCIDTSVIQSFQCAKIAAEGGHDEGQRIYGLFHMYGYGTHRSDADGIRWLEASANQGNILAMKELGNYHYDKADYIRYAYWLKKAAESGSAEAQFNYSNLIYDNSLGIPTNENDACKWAELAARQKYEPAYVSVGWYYRTGRGGAKQDVEKAKQWFQAGIKEFNNVECMWQLAEALPSNDVEKIMLLEQAAGLGHKSALAELANMNVDNKIPNADRQWGINTLESLALEENPRAMAYYGAMLYDGVKLKRNRKKGLSLINKAANAGDLMGNLYKRYIEATK